MKISAIVIGYNEAKYVKRCLDNCLKWADEVIYFDSFSTDGSDEVAKSYINVKFFQHRYDNTRDQRNRALSEASHEWRFILDVDEYLSEEMILLLSQFDFKRFDYSSIDAVSLPRWNMVDGVGPMAWPEWTVHLVRRGVLHGGHPLHADRAAGVPWHHRNSLPAEISLPKFDTEPRVIHEKSAVQWMERARIYWWMCPYTFLPKRHSGLPTPAEYRLMRPPGSEDLIPPTENWNPDRTNIDVMTEFMDKGLDKRLTAGYLADQGLEITLDGWRRKP